MPERHLSGEHEPPAGHTRRDIGDQRDVADPTAELPDEAPTATGDVTAVRPGDEPPAEPDGAGRIDDDDGTDGREGA